MQIKFDQKDMAEIHRLLSSQDTLYNRVAFRIMQRVVAGVKTDIDVEIRGVYNLSKSRVMRGISTTVGSIQNPNFSVQVGRKGDGTAKPVGLAQFGARQTAKGVSVQVMSSGQRTIIPHTFIANVKQGTGRSIDVRHVFQRIYRRKNLGPFNFQANRKIPYANLPSKYSYDLHRHTGPRLADAFKESRPASVENVVRKGWARIEVELARQYDMAFKDL